MRFLNIIVFAFLSHYCYGLTQKETLFRQFMQKYGRRYKAGTSEYRIRFKNFLMSLRRHSRLNYSGAGGFGVNRFSDLSRQEFRAMYLKPMEEWAVPLVLPTATADIPRMVDWRAGGFVTKVKNQKSCGGCWAFSLVESIESMHAIRTSAFNLTDLSVQQLIDCGVTEQQCNGGDPCRAAQWLVESKSNVTKERNYPLKDTSEICGGRMSDGVTVESNICIRRPTNETAVMTSLLSKGPVTVSVDATLWQDYIGGVIRHHCLNHLNHAVQIVGYNLGDPVPHYIVRNSWGTAFGNQGYLKIAIGGNVCGVAEQIVAVTTL